MEQKLMVYNSIIGRIYCRLYGDYLTGLSIGRNEFEGLKGSVVLHSLKRELDEYFQGRLFCFSQKVIFMEGTDFQKLVWTRLMQVKYGETVSYREMAEQIDLEKGYQAVGSALSKNPILLIVPCHRVIGSDGLLKGFSAGLPIKKWLLNHEKRFSKEIQG